jgi:hypothetical protein
LSPLTYVLQALRDNKVKAMNVEIAALPSSFDESYVDTLGEFDRLSLMQTGLKWPCERRTWLGDVSEGW